ncbi:YwbE family protein [Peribacillus sp. N1]
MIEWLQITLKRIELNMNGKNRKDVTPGASVDIVLKADQRTGKLTSGTVKDILTNSSTHPHGIKVRLTDGQVGRVQVIHK